VESAGLRTSDPPCYLIVQPAKLMKRQTEDHASDKLALKMKML
jgi:hypothetical protein